MWHNVRIHLRNSRIVRVALLKAGGLWLETPGQEELLCDFLTTWPLLHFSVIGSVLNINALIGSALNLKTLTNLLLKCIHVSCIFQNVAVLYQMIKHDQKKAVTTQLFSDIRFPIVSLLALLTVFIPHTKGGPGVGVPISVEPARCCYVHKRRWRILLAATG